MYLLGNDIIAVYITLANNQNNINYKYNYVFFAFNNYYMCVVILIFMTY